MLYTNASMCKQLRLACQERPERHSQRKVANRLRGVGCRVRAEALQNVSMFRLECFCSSQWKNLRVCQSSQGKHNAGALWGMNKIAFGVAKGTPGTRPYCIVLRHPNKEHYWYHRCCTT